MTSKSFYIKTFGCQMNEYDSNKISDLMKTIEYMKTDKIDEADCFIFNTCHIREKATQKVYSDIGKIKKIYQNRRKPIQPSTLGLYSIRGTQQGSTEHGSPPSTLNP